MKKNTLFISAIAIVALSVFNLNISLNKENKVGIEIANKLSIAKNEDNGGRTCGTVVTMTQRDCWTIWEFWCGTGTDTSCQNGWEIARECEPYTMDWNVTTYSCSATTPN